MARRKYDESGEHHERWLISYADFITLLFAFFVVMYAISVVNEGKYKVLSNALGDAFGARGKATQSNAVVEQPLPLTSIIARKRLESARRDREMLTALARQLTSRLAPLVRQGKVHVTQNGRGVTVEINASLLFAPGDPTPTRDARETVQAVGALLKDDPHAIQVEGHTDDVPIRNALFASNWELSAVRASSVVRLFIDSGVAARRLTAVGNAANDPVASNADEAGRARNRRVAVTILAALPENQGEGVVR